MPTSICASCGEPKQVHYTAVTKVIHNPFGPDTTEYILLCRSATFAETAELKPPSKPKRPLKVVK